MTKMLKSELRSLFKREYRLFAIRALFWRTLGLLFCVIPGLPGVIVSVLGAVCEYLTTETRWLGLFAVPAKWAFKKHAGVCEEACEYTESKSDGW